jgi:hypothetical protein
MVISCAVVGKKIFGRQTDGVQALGNDDTHGPTTGLGPDYPLSMDTYLLYIKHDLARAFSAPAIFRQGPHTHTRTHAHTAGRSTYAADFLGRSAADFLQRNSRRN